MAVREIVLYPHPVLKKSAAPVERFDDELRLLLQDMAETMYDAPGIGLAAPQIGVSLRAIVIDVTPEPEDDDEDSDRDNAQNKPAHAPVTPDPSRPGLIKMLNPEIVAAEKQIVMEEGCLSIPGVREKVKRSESITVTGRNEHGDELVIEASGLLAVCFQHEIDHLDGVLFIDRLSPLKQEMVRNRLKKHPRSESN